jgi:type II secretory pathway pseudopilin PulG
VTLFEVLIVTAILSLLSSGIALAVLHYLDKARVDTAKLEAKQILTAVNLWRADHPGECPHCCRARCRGGTGVALPCGGPESRWTTPRDCGLMF